jgi:GNAT superfamily N-acetyltransferase
VYTRVIDLDELFAFFDKEKVNWPDLTDTESSLVRKDPDRFYILTILVGVFDDAHTLVGYGSVPSYTRDILISLYVSKSHRQQGYGRKLVNDLGIKHLSCLKDNQTGLLFYENLGFHRSRHSQHLIYYERNHV